MDITQWQSIAAVVASPLGTVVLAFFVWKMTGEIREMKKAMYENGFVKQSDIARELSIARDAHNRYEEDIKALQGDVRRLDDDKLSVRDYDREKQRRGR